MARCGRNQLRSRPKTGHGIHLHVTKTVAIFITLHLIDEILDVDLHRGTSVRVVKYKMASVTPSSNSTILKSNKSAKRIMA
jgi:hypothetical protein